MTKTEQKVFDRVKADNDAGHGCYNPVIETKGVRRSWRHGGGYSSGGPNKLEQAALERLVASGAVILVNGRHVIADHPVLASMAAEKDLMRLARQVEEKRADLERAEKWLTDAQSFVRKYGMNLSD